MSNILRILILEDVPEDAELVKRQLRKNNIAFTSTVVDTREGFLKELKGFRPDLIIADYSLPSFNAMEAIEIVQKRAPQIPVIVCTGSISEDIAMECIKAGAVDYVIKEHITRLGSAVKSAMEKKYALEEKARAEEALRESEEKYRKHFEMISDAIYVIDQETGRILDVNKAAISMYGYSREEWLKMKNTDVSAEPEKTREATKKAPEQIPIRFHKKKDGTIFPLEMSINTHVLKGRRVIICTARDITERKQAEEALRESEERLKILFEFAPDAYYLNDLKGNFVDGNKAAEQVIGYQREDMVGKSFLKLKMLSAEQIPKAAKLLAQNAMGHPTGPDEFILNRKDGSQVSVEINTFPIKIKGKTMVLGIAHNITERKRAEEAIRLQTKDLTLINELNNAVNRGDSLKEIIESCSRKTGEVFSCFGAAVHLLSDDKQYLTMQNLPLSKKRINQIEKLIGFKLPVIKIPLKPEGLYQEILKTEKPRLFLEPESSHRQIREYINELTVSNDLLRKQLRKIVPQAQKILSMRSTMVVPLISDGEAIGALDISRKEPFTESDLQRLQIMSGQMTVAIKRKRAEEALRESHEYTRNLIDSSLDMIIAVDNKRRITEFNQAAEEVFGYRREEVLGKHVNLLYADPKEGLTIHKKTVLNGQHVQEIRNRRKNGETFLSLLASSVLLDPGGEKVGVMGVLRDITHQKQDKELLQFQANVLSNVRDSVIVTDLQGRIIYWNIGATELYGYTADEMIGQNPVVLYPDQDPELLAENLKSIVPGKNLTGAWKGRCKDGSEIWVAMKTALARDAAGNPIGFIGVTRDITGRKQAEEKLKLSDQIISHIENLVLVFDEGGKAIFAGPSVTHVLGYSRKEVLGDGWSKLTCRDDKERKRGKAYIKRVITNREKIKSEPYERQTYDKEGRPRWILWQDASGPGNTLIEIGHDITEYKSLESQLIQGEKLRAVGELAAGIAHEINSPIQFIGDNLRFLEEANQKTSGLLERLRRPDEIRKGDERLSGVLDAQSHELSTKDIDYYAEEIPKAIEQSLDGVSRISEIVQAMRTFSHPGGKEKTTIDINQAIESTITVSRNEWKYVAELQTDLDPNLPPVPCLAGEMNQVFLNLIVNAAQAIQETQEAGVSQEKGTIAISTRQEKGNLEVHISDNGPGVPEEIKSRIFEPFFTTKGVGRGTGQGLAIAHMVIVEKHGGSITLETEKGKGATFIIRLPFEPPLEKEPA